MYSSVESTPVPFTLGDAEELWTEWPEWARWDTLQLSSGTRPVGRVVTLSLVEAERERRNVDARHMWATRIAHTYQVPVSTVYGWGQSDLVAAVASACGRRGTVPGLRVDGRRRLVG